MQFLIVLAILIVISVGLAYRSLRHLMLLREVGGCQKELLKGKIIYKTDYSSSRGSSS